MGKSSKGRVELLITNVNPDIKRQLKNVAKYEQNSGVSEFIRPHLRKVLERYPDDIKNPPNHQPDQQ